MGGKGSRVDAGIVKNARPIKFLFRYVDENSMKPLLREHSSVFRLRSANYAYNNVDKSHGIVQGSTV